jgi:hypothetical protein
MAFYGGGDSSELGRERGRREWIERSTTHELEGYVHAWESQAPQWSLVHVVHGRQVIPTGGACSQLAANWLFAQITKKTCSRVVNFDFQNVKC